MILLEYSLVLFILGQYSQIHRTLFSLVSIRKFFLNYRFNYLFYSTSFHFQGPVIHMLDLLCLALMYVIFFIKNNFSFHLFLVKH